MRTRLSGFLILTTTAALNNGCSVSDISNTNPDHTNPLDPQMSVTYSPGTSLAGLATVFQNDPSTLALLELNGNASDISGNGRSPTLLGGTFVPTAWGMGLRLSATDPQGLDWSAYASLLKPPYTIELVIVPDSVSCYAKLFGFNDSDDRGWYYCNGFQAYPNTAVAGSSVPVGTRHYLALTSVSTSTTDGGASTVLVYSQGVKIGSTPASFTAPPSAAVFFRDDSGTSRREQLRGTIEAMRISSVSRTSTEIAAVQARLATQP